MDTDPDVTSFQYEPVHLPYGNGKVTIPDFIVTLSWGEKVLVETKSSYGVTLSQEKMEAAQVWAEAQGMRYVVLTEHELFE